MCDHNVTTRIDGNNFQCLICDTVFPTKEIEIDHSKIGQSPLVGGGPIRLGQEKNHEKDQPDNTGGESPFEDLEIYFRHIERGRDFEEEACSAIDAHQAELSQGQRSLFPAAYMQEHFNRYWSSILARLR